MSAYFSSTRSAPLPQTQRFSRSPTPQARSLSQGLRKTPTQYYEEIGSTAKEHAKKIHENFNKAQHAVSGNFQLTGPHVQGITTTYVGLLEEIETGKETPIYYVTNLKDGSSYYSVGGNEHEDLDKAIEKYMA